MAKKEKITLLLIRASGLLVIGAQAYQTYDLDSCQPIHNPEKPSSVEYRCQRRQEIIIRKGDLPESIRNLSISGAARITILQDALLDQSALVNLTISNVTMLQLNKLALNLPAGARLFSLDIENAEAVHIFDSAFSGIWAHSIHVNVKNINLLNIEQGAFYFTSSSLGPSLNLENIQALSVSPRSFSAPISLLTLRQVNMTTCFRGSFGTEIHSLEFHRVNITDAMPECFQSRNASEKLQVHSSNLENIHSHAFTGNLHLMTIESSTFKNVYPSGFEVDVKNFRVTHTYFENLLSNAFCIRAGTSFRLEDIGVHKLKKEALAGIRSIRSSPGDQLHLTIRGLQIFTAEDGSLALEKCSRPSVSGLDIRRPWPLICPTEKWTRLLMGVSDGGKLNHVESAVFRALRQRQRCPDDSYVSLTNKGDGCEEEDVAPSCMTESASAGTELMNSTGDQSFMAIYGRSIASFEATRQSNEEEDRSETAEEAGDLPGPGNSKPADDKFEETVTSDSKPAKTTHSDGNTSHLNSILIPIIVIITAAILGLLVKLFKIHPRRLFSTGIMTENSPETDDAAYKSIAVTVD